MLAAPNPPLSDGVVSLRPPEERDLSAIERGINDPEVIRWFGRPTQSAEELLELNQRRWNDGESATFAICEAADLCVGHVWVNLVDARRGFVGYWLLADVRGRGLAARAVRLVSRWALRDLALARVALLTETSNGPSQRVAERTGFQREGVLRSYGEIDGRRVDFISFFAPPTRRRAGGLSVAA